MGAFLGNALIWNYNGQHQTGRMSPKLFCDQCLNPKLTAETIPEI